MILANVMSRQLLYMALRKSNYITNLGCQFDLIKNVKIILKKFGDT
jgi:hypothetical protein